MNIDFPHRRKNLLNGEWILVSPHRTKRPWQGKQEEIPANNKPRYDEKCYLCPGNERAGGNRNPEYNNTYVFTNDFAAILSEAPKINADADSLFQMGSVTGTSRVICFSPRHDLTLPEMPVEVIRNVVDLWSEQFAELSGKYPWVQIFENKGAIMGCSNPHPHGQIWAGSVLPNEAEKELFFQKEYYAKNKSSLLVDYLNEELARGERIIVENDSWVSLVPFWAKWPFETMLLPKRDVQNLTQLNKNEKNDLANILKIHLTKYDNLFNVSFPYTMGWHNAPADGSQHTHWQLHAHFYPPLLRSATVQKFMVGYELLSESQRDITPESAADRLKGLPEIHFNEG